MSSEKRKTEDGTAGAPTSKRGRWDSDGAAPAPAAAANGTNGTALDPQSTRAKIEAAKAKLAKAKEMLANRQKGAAVRLEPCLLASVKRCPATCHDPGAGHTHFPACTPQCNKLAVQCGVQMLGVQCCHPLSQQRNLQASSHETAVFYASGSLLAVGTAPLSCTPDGALAWPCSQAGVAAAQPAPAATAASAAAPAVPSAAAADASLLTRVAAAQTAAALSGAML